MSAENNNSNNNNMQRSLVKVLNGLALMMVMGCILYMASSSSSLGNSDVSAADVAKYGLQEQDAIVLPTSQRKKKRRVAGVTPEDRELYHYVSDF